MPSFYCDNILQEAIEFERDLAYITSSENKEWFNKLIETAKTLYNNQDTGTILVYQSPRQSDIPDYPADNNEALYNLACELIKSGHNKFAYDALVCIDESSKYFGEAQYTIGLFLFSKAKEKKENIENKTNKESKANKDNQDNKDKVETSGDLFRRALLCFLKCINTVQEGKGYVIFTMAMICGIPENEFDLHFTSLDKQKLFFEKLNHYAKQEKDQTVSKELQEVVAESAKFMASEFMALEKTTASSSASALASASATASSSASSSISSSAFSGSLADTSANASSVTAAVSTSILTSYNAANRTGNSTVDNTQKIGDVQKVNATIKKPL